MLKIIKKYWLIIMIVGFVLLDQISKGILIYWLQEGSKSIISNLFQLEIVKNTGGAFGVGEGNITMFVVTNFVVLGIIIRFLITQKDQMDKKTKIVLGLILAGGFSNLLDRVIRGYVVDYIKVANFPVFNLADCLIVIGWVIFCFIIAKYTWFEMKKKKEK